MKLNLVLFALLYANLLSAQRLSFQWDKDPKIHNTCEAAYLKESAIILLEKVQLEYALDAKKNPIFKRRLHKLVKVNDEKGIEMYNKIKINYNPVFPINSIKARTILKNGKVIELQPDAFKDMKEEDGTTNKIFAFEGIEPGAEVEYLVELTQPVSYFGSYMVQDIIPTCKGEYEILCPTHLYYELKGYNKVTVDKDSSYVDFNSFYAHAENLPGLEEEKMATFYPHFARIEYSLAYNTEGKGKGIRILNWDDAAKNLHKNFTSFKEKELSALAKLIEKNEVYQKCASTKEKILWIEEYVKTNFVQQEYVPDENAESIEFILKNKLTNETGIKLLFSALFQSQKIRFEIGYTTDRFSKAFDYSFPNWDNLKYGLFYFPEIKQFMAPNRPDYRTPFIPANWCANQSMFCKVLKLGEVEAASAEKRMTPEFSADLSYHDHDVEVFFNESMDTTRIEMKNTFAGFNALDLMPVFVYLEKDKRDDATKEILRLSEKDEKMENFVYENNSFISVAQNKPLVIKATIQATNNIEKAGNKFLFKVGELIGRQSEMYQEKERQFDIEIANPHQYTRKLKVHIPEGYKVSNLEKLNINFKTMVNGKENCKFVSGYAMNGNTLDIEVVEVYHSSFTPKAVYEDYRKVINAAADFNKVVLILEKK